MAFSGRFLEEVKDRNDIVEFISRYVQLKRAGSNFSGLCPFHNEKTPSFTVFPGTRSFYCFGCGTGGDIFTFAMQAEGLDYPETVELLAKRAGIPMEEDEFRPRNEVRRERVVAATTEAARFFHKALFSEGGEKAREYLLEKRKLSPATVKHFGIGYAPSGWDNLGKYLSAKGFTDKELDAAFLCRLGQKGRYDIFRNRIMFPLIDINGDVLGFSARRLNEEDERKYVNTSDTPAFKKSKFIFAMNFAKNTTDGSLIMCEGCVDAVALHQAGFGQAVATLGTAITAEQARIIARHAKQVYLAYDIDAAGRKATLKGIELLSQVGVSAKIINLGSSVKDPDEYIKKFGADAFKRVLSASSGQIDYQIDEIAERYNLEIPEEKLRALNALAEFAARSESKAQREVCAARIAKKLEISYQAVTDEVERKVKFTVKKKQNDFEHKEIQNTLGFGDKLNRDKIKLPAAAMIEEKILGILLLHPEFYRDVSEQFNAESFLTEFNAKIFTAFLPDFEAGREPILSKESLSPEEVSKAVMLMAARQTFSDNGKGVLTELIEALEKEKLKAEYDKKITDGGAEALLEYINKLKNKES